MTDDTISPLRRRMIEDMTVRGFTACTQRGYIAAVRRFTVFLGRSPDQATAEDLRHFQLQMRLEGASSTTMNAAVSALRFLFGVTLSRGDHARADPRVIDNLARLYGEDSYRAAPLLRQHVLADSGFGAAAALLGTPHQ